MTILVLILVGALIICSTSCTERHEPAPAATRSRTLTQVEAEKIALTLAPGRIAKSQLTLERGREVWEVEVYLESKGMRELHLDALTGDLLKEDFDESPKTKISKEHAESIAISGYPGKVLGSELEQEGRLLSWCIEIATRTGRKEIYVDSATGSVNHVHDVTDPDSQ